MFLNQRKYLIKILFVAAFVVFPTLMLWGQNAGDFRSGSSGLWTSAATWETYNGTAWVAATNYPGQNAGNYAVEIRAGSTISTSALVTQPIGTLLVNGTLSLNGSTNSTTIVDIKTMEIIIPQNVTPADNATIAFLNKCWLILPANAVIKVQHGLTASCKEGLSGDCNNNEEIHIGTFNIANCHGAPGSLFTFAELMNGGGTLVAIQVVPPKICQGEEIQLSGSYVGTTFSSGVSYNWSNTGPATLVFNPSNTDQNPTITPTVAGIYNISLTVTTSNGSIYYNNIQSKTLIVAPTSSMNNVAICQGDSTLFNGKYYKSPGTYTSNTLPSSQQCDSTAILNLTVLDTYNTIIRDTICEGESYIFNGVSYTFEGSYIVNVGVGAVCNITTLALKVNKPSSFDYNYAICQGESYSFNGNIYNSTGTYVYHTINSVGCDSTVTLHLTVNPLPIITNTSLTQTICSGTSITSVALTSDVASTTFEWSASSDSGITGFSASGSNTIPTETLINPGNTTAGTVTYVITPKANGCTGPPVNYVITVTPKPATSDIYHQ